MSKVNDYLTKQLFIEKNVVTYRSLSRALNIHVNEAKNELAIFLASPRPAPEQPYATYIISGETRVPLRPRRKNDSNKSADAEMDKMDVDLEESLEDVIGDIVPRTTMVLAGQVDLDRARARFNRVHSEHIYSLSPSPLHDAGLICSSSSQTYEADAKVSAEASILLGRIVGPHVHVGKVNPSNVASSSKSQAVPPRKPGLKKEEKVLTPEPKLKRTNTSDPVKKEVKEEEVLPEKPTKTTGKLDWSKAKPKGTKEGKSSKTEEKKMKEEAMDTDIAEETEKKLSVAKGKDVAKNGPNTLAPEQPKRGTKRKSALQMDSDSESEGKPLPLAKPPIRGSKRKSAQDSDAESGDDSAHRKPAVPTKGKGKKVIVSDDEEEEEAPSKPKYRSKQAATKPSARMKKQEEVPQSLKAMFDVDDDQVIQGSSRPTDKRPSTEPDSQPQDEDVEMTVEDDDPVVKKGPPKKKKEKKVVPVGRNGLKKRRIVKQKTFVDDGGYMVTEDYSSYESVGEEEPEEPKSKRGAKSKKATESPEDPKPAKASLKEPRKANTAKSSDTSSAKKASGSKLSAKGSIQTFFTKK